MMEEEEKQKEENEERGQKRHQEHEKFAVLYQAKKRKKLLPSVAARPASGAEHFADELNEMELKMAVCTVYTHLKSADSKCTAWHLELTLKYQSRTSIAHRTQPRSSRT